MSFHVPEGYRLKSGLMKSDSSFGNFGAFEIPFESRDLAVVASAGMPPYNWEHVSVSLENRCPNWREMCFIKNLFWDDEDVVIQYHPKKSDYVNVHNYCLHLWRPTKEKLPIPPKELVG